MMCIKPEEVHKIVREQVQDQVDALEKNLTLQFDKVNSNINNLTAQVTKINGRLGGAESNIRALQDHRLSRTYDCPFKDDIDVLKSKYITDQTLREHMEREAKEREKREEKRERNTRILISVAVFALSLITFFTNYFM